MAATSAETEPGSSKRSQRVRQKCFPRWPFYKKFKGIKIIDNITVDRYNNNKAGDLNDDK